MTPPAAAGPTDRAYDAAVAALTAQWAHLLEAAPAVLRDPGGTTRVPGWGPADVLAHLALTTEGLTAVLDAPPPVLPKGARPAGPAGWSAALPDLAPALDEAARGAAGDDPLARLTAAVAGATAALTRTPSGRRLVGQRTGVHTALDAVRFRVVEAVVHGLDLGVAPLRDATAVAVRTLLDALVGLAPGGAVEVRVPPFAAVQCGGGAAAHTRGTPPRTLELGPLDWLDVATGRVPLATTLADGRARAHGDVEVVAAVLPVLR